MKKIFTFILGAVALLTSCSDSDVTSSLGPDNPDGPSDEIRPITRTDTRGMVISYDDKNPSRGALISWKWMSGDPENAAYDIYRKVGDGNWQKLNETPISTSTNYKDVTMDPAQTNIYELRFADSDETLATCKFSSDMGQTFYRSVFLNNSNLPDPTFKYRAADAAVGDLDGDGEYEIVIRREVEDRDPGGTNWKGNSKGSTIYEAYKISNGAFLWRVDTGINVPQGNHYASFIVYDLDGDGKAEVAIKTSEGTTFGDGTAIGDVNGDGITDYRNPATGRVLAGPEFLSIVDGMTGKELARTDYIPRGDKEDWIDYWGDNVGNRIDRFLMGVGHFVAQNSAPSIVMCRGYYENYQIVALDYANGKLTKRWHFNTYPGYSDYAGQGNHNLSVGDVDNDGKDEIIYGACAIDHNGKGLYTTELGHGDALHLGKFDPTLEGLQVVACHEEPKFYREYGAEFRDAATGKLIWGIPGNGEDVGRCMVADIDPDTPGCEVWASSTGGRLYSCKGELLAKSAPMIRTDSYTYNMGIWWDGSLNRQMIDANRVLGYIDSDGNYTSSPNRIFEGSTYGVVPINGSKKTPCVYADIWGDWREEMIFVVNDGDSDDDGDDDGWTELRIFTTNIETEYRFRPLMDDHIYRLSAAHQNVGYNQPTHTSFYIGSDLLKADKKK
ncbi:rhamnogalacturonan lyase [Bacteroides finegoldii]|uniref:rhamnogalacturonan lyase family protein n=1 Tax=Bacteroides finegoldii TaxID=338188 RepID=UPI00189C6FD9|nr:rhamnogalacturonan lyase [Bacteroides finegoldii]